MSDRENSHLQSARPTVSAPRHLLRDRWASFVSIALDPWTILLILISVGLFEVSRLDPTGASSPAEEVEVVLFVVTGLVTAILGGRVTKAWDERFEEKVIVARGQTAIRGLQLMTKSIVALDRRVGQYLKRLAASEADGPVGQETIKTYLEEVSQRCQLLGDEALSSIDNWNDVIPEANVTVQQGLYSEFAAENARLLLELDSTRRQMEETVAESAQTANTLRDKLLTTNAALEASRSRFRKLDPLGVGSTASSLGGAVPFISTYNLGRASDFWRQASDSSVVLDYPDVQRFRELLARGGPEPSDAEPEDESGTDEGSSESTE